MQKLNGEIESTQKRLEYLQKFSAGKDRMKTIFGVKTRLNRLYAKRFLLQIDSQPVEMEMRKEITSEEKYAFQQKLLQTKQRVLARGIVGSVDLGEEMTSEELSENLHSEGSILDMPGENTGEWVEFGKASYYADFFEGRKMASGVKFSNHLTNGIYYAAHREMPFGNRLKVTNIANGKSVIVTVMDRGPYAHTALRIIDLAKDAFSQIAPISNGVINVKIEIIPSDE